MNEPQTFMKFDTQIMWDNVRAEDVITRTVILKIQWICPDSQIKRNPDVGVKITVKSPFINSEHLSEHVYYEVCHNGWQTRREPGSPLGFCVRIWFISALRIFTTADVKYEL